MSATQERRERKKITFVCGEHGQQRIVAFSHAKIVIGCGCGWSLVGRELEHSDERQWWAYKVWLAAQKKKRSRP